MGTIGHGLHFHPAQRISILFYAALLGLYLAFSRIVLRLTKSTTGRVHLVHIGACLSNHVVVLPPPTHTTNSRLASPGFFHAQRREIPVA
jgi:hypothetical protein